MGVMNNQKGNEFTEWGMVAALPFYGFFGLTKYPRILFPEQTREVRDHVADFISRSGIDGEKVTQFLQDNASTGAGSIFILGLMLSAANLVLEENTKLPHGKRRTIAGIVGTVAGIGGLMTKEICDTFVNNPLVEMSQNEFLQRFDWGDAKSILVAAAVVLPLFIIDSMRDNPARKNRTASEAVPG